MQIEFRKPHTLITLAILLIFSSCQYTPDNDNSDVIELKHSEYRPSKPESLQETANKTLRLLQEGGFDTLVTYTLPNALIRFSPYAHIDLERDKAISAEGLQKLWADTIRLNWGNFDGSGAPIYLSVKNYFKRFVNDRDYLKADTILQNASLAAGNSLNNIKAAYPETEYVEYYFRPEKEQINWSALRLVFKKFDKRYYLVGIIHDQWTI